MPSFLLNSENIFLVFMLYLCYHKQNTRCEMVRLELNIPQIFSAKEMLFNELGFYILWLVYCS